MVRLINGKQYKKLVHRLVAETFIDNPKNLPEVNHKDNNPKNNNVENLEWCDRKYNLQQSYKRYPPNRNTIKCILLNNMKYIKTFDCIKDAAEYAHIHFNSSITTLRKYKKHKAIEIKEI